MNVLTKNNYQIAASCLSNAREDHSDGVNAIYRLAAQVPIPKKTSPDELRRLIKELAEDLSIQKVLANRITIHKKFLEVDYYPKGFQMAMNRGQYTGLVLEFAHFLNETGINEITIQDGFYMEEPDASVKSVGNDLINFFPEFNSKCFGASNHESIQIVNLNRFKKSFRETKELIS